MIIRWMGTAAVEYSEENGRILFDPFVPLPGSEHQVDIGEFDGFSDILITHGHFDHLVNVPDIVRRNPETRVYCSKTPYQTLIHKGVPEKNLRQLCAGDRLQLNGFSIEVYQGKHALLPEATPGRLWSILKRGHFKNLWFIIKENRQCQENDETLMFLIERQGTRILHMGSMNLREDVDYPSGCDLLLLPYNGWEDNEPPAERVIRRLNPREVILHHFDNAFPPVSPDPEIGKLLERYGDRVVVPKFRESIRR